MAKLIVTRPRIKRFGTDFGGFRIVVDGTTIGRIGAGMAVEFPLPPGHHQVGARLGFFQSRPVDLDVGAEEIRTLRVIGNPRADKLLRYAAMLPSFVALGVVTWELSSGGPRSVMDFGWLKTLAFLGSFLPAALLLLFLRDDYLVFDEIPSLTLTEGRIAALMDPQPLRFRATIRQLMIAVAIVALFIWIGIEGTRRERSSLFQSRAYLHSRLEEIAREDEQHYHRMAAISGDTEPDASSYRKKAAKAAARADYHAAMKRKYEEAIARGAFSVEPDPPEPPWR